jgi:hypothetical protein
MRQSLTPMRKTYRIIVFPQVSGVTIQCTKESGLSFVLCQKYFLYSGNSGPPCARSTSCTVATVGLPCTRSTVCIVATVGPLAPEVLPVQWQQWAPLCQKYFLYIDNSGPPLCQKYFLYSGNGGPPLCQKYFLYNGNSAPPLVPEVLPVQWQQWAP